MERWRWGASRWLRWRRAAAWRREATATWIGEVGVEDSGMEEEEGHGGGR